jgi:hypothetical protein
MNPPDFFNLPPPPQETDRVLVARHLKASINVELQRRIENHVSGYNAFWHAPCTPDDVLKELGTDARTVIECSRANLRNLHELAQLVGKTLLDFMPAEQWMPKREFIEHPDGTVTMSPPKPGFDEWGNPTDI